MISLCTFVGLCGGILSGRWDHNEREPNIHHHKPEYPQILTEQEGATMDVTCTKPALYHLWYHGYVKDGEFKEITDMPLLVGEKTPFYRIIVEKFDNNSYIYCGADNSRNEVLYTSFEIKNAVVLKVPNETQKPIEYNATLRYSQTKKAYFSCEKYTNITQDNVHVGVINLTSNTISTYNNQKSIYTYYFNIMDSGRTVLCCIYYEVIDFKKKKYIIRHIVDKTLLIYDIDIRNNISDTGSWSNSRPPVQPSPGNSWHIIPSLGTSTGYPFTEPTPPNQNITCIHRYQNDKQQKEIFNYTHNVPIQDINSSFIIKVENFDNNTLIYCMRNRTDIFTKTIINAEIGTKKSVFTLSASNFSNVAIISVTNFARFTGIKNEEYKNIKYNETKNVSFSCEEYTNKTKYVQLGIINTTSNMIETQSNTTMNQTFNMTRNGTILCCIYYVPNEYNAKQFTRFVTSKTLLVYDDAKKNVHPDIPKDTENITSSADTNPDDTVPSDGYRIYKIVSAVVLTVVILLIVFALWKRRSRKKLKSDLKVLYAELDHHHHGSGPGPSGPDVRNRPNTEEESPYAEIIGVMRPQ